MNIVLSCIGRRGYIAQMLREADPKVRIIGTSSLPLTPGFHVCDEAYVLPPIVSEEYPRVVVELCQKVQARAITSLYDADIDRLSPHRGSFSAIGVAPLLVTKATSDICFDKALTAEYLTQKGYLVPQTFTALAEAEDALRIGTLKFPLMVKPRFGFGSNDLFRARSAAELRVFFEYRKGMIIQEMLQGQEFGIDVLGNLEGHAVSVAVKRKLAMRAGETDQAVTVRDPNLERIAVELVNALNVVGPFDMDVFLTERGPYILELNPRFGGGYPFSHMAGADHPGKLVRLLKGEHLKLEHGVKREGLVLMKDLLFRTGEPQSVRFPPA